MRGALCDAGEERRYVRLSAAEFDRAQPCMAEQGDLPPDYAMGRFWAAPPRLARLALRGLGIGLA